MAGLAHPQGWALSRAGFAKTSRGGEETSMVDPGLTTLEAVALAVRSEIESTDIYEKLAARVKNPVVKTILTDLAADEEKHRQGLMNLYKRMLGDQEAAIPESDGREKKMDLAGDAAYEQVLKAARDKEFDSERFYKEAAGKVREYRTQMFFLDVAESERKHAATLQKLLDQLKEDPHWFERDEADPYKGHHVGP
jgi:rubrerythrin